MDGRTKELAEEVDWEREVQETAVKTAKEKIKAADTIEEKATAAEKNRAMAEKSPRNSWLSRTRQMLS